MDKYNAQQNGRAWNDRWRGGRSGLFAGRICKNTQTGRGNKNARYPDPDGYERFNDLHPFAKRGRTAANYAVQTESVCKRAGKRFCKVADKRAFDGRKFFFGQYVAITSNDEYKAFFAGHGRNDGRNGVAAKERAEAKQRANKEAEEISEAIGARWIYYRLQKLLNLEYKTVYYTDFEEAVSFASINAQFE